MKKRIIIVSILILSILAIQVSKVIAVTDNEFFYTNKKEICSGEEIEITLDISKIQYNEFEFKLSSNLDSSNIIINEDIKLDNDNNELSINIDKEKININKITFYYQVPEKSIIGSKIELEAQILVEIQENELENEVNTEIKKETQLQVVESKKIEVMIVENKQKDNQEKQNEEKDKEKTNIPTQQVEKINTDMPNNNETKKTTENFETNLSANTNKSMPNTKMQSNSYSVNTINLNSVPSQTETAVYNGSNNNYLENLEIEGENLNTTFNKENTTYFVQTEGKTELNVKTTAEDDDAKINITGNENLKTGANKILISVTAQNGDVRYYRIFVTNN